MIPQLSKNESEQDLANMKSFKGRAGQSVSITGSVGDHTLAGFIAVKEKELKNGSLGSLITLLVLQMLLFLQQIYKFYILDGIK